MELNIEIIDRKPKKRRGVVSVEGQLEIGDDFYEILYMPLDLWTIDDYERQWQEGLARLNNHDKSCLVVTIHNPKLRYFVEWWLLYKIDNKIHIQNQMLMGEIYANQIGNTEFTVENCYDFVPPKDMLFDDEEEYPVSEWIIDYP